MNEVITLLLSLSCLPATVQVQGTMAGETRVSIDGAANDWSTRERLDLWLTPALHASRKVNALRSTLSYEPILQVTLSPTDGVPYLLHRATTALHFPIARKTQIEVSAGLGFGTIDFVAANLPLQTPFGFLSRAGAIPVAFGGFGLRVAHRPTALSRWTAQSMVSHFAVPTAPDGRELPLQTQAHLEAGTSRRTRSLGTFEVAVSADATFPYLLAEEPRTPRGVPAYSSLQPEFRWRQQWSPREHTFLRAGWLLGRQRVDYLFLDTLPLSFPVVTVEQGAKPRRLWGLQHSFGVRGGLLPLYDPFLLGMTERIFFAGLVESTPVLTGRMRFAVQYDDKLASVLPARTRSAETRDQLFRAQGILELPIYRNLWSRIGLFATFRRPWPASRVAESMQLMMIAGIQYDDLWSI